MQLTAAPPLEFETISSTTTTAATITSIHADYYTGTLEQSKVSELVGSFGCVCWLVLVQLIQT